MARRKHVVSPAKTPVITVRCSASREALLFPAFAQNPRQLQERRSALCDDTMYKHDANGLSQACDEYEIAHRKKPPSQLPKRPNDEMILAENRT